MAGAGDLVVRVGIDAAQFTDGLTDAERKAKRFADALSTGFSNAAALGVTALAGIATGAVAALSAMDKLVKQAGDFQDLAEKTGASAEGLASFAVAAATAGTSVTEIANASIILSKNLAGATEESKGAAKALQAIGITLSDFKKLAPEEQIRTLAKTLDQFADGSGKTAVLVAALGKSGAQLGPALKEIAAQAEVNIGLTGEQIKVADDYADSQARLSAQLQLYAQIASVQAVPALNDLLGAFGDLAKEIVNVDGASNSLANDNPVGRFAEKAVDVLAFLIDAGRGVAQVFEVVGNAIAATAFVAEKILHLDFKAALNGMDQFVERQNEILAAESFRDRIEKQRAARQANAAGNTKELDTLKKQVDFTNVLDKKEKDRASRLSQEERDRIKRLERISDLQRQAITDQGDDELALSAAAANTDLENNNNRFNKLNDLTGRSDAAQTEADFQLLNDALNKGEISLEEYSAAGKKLFPELQKGAKESADAFDDFAKKARENIQDIFADSILDAIQGKSSNILKSCSDLFQKIAAQAIAADITSSLFGSANAQGKSNGDGLIQTGFAAAKAYFGFANGGILPTDRMSLVGERGPEFVMPSSAGMKVTPNAKLGNTVINFTVNANDVASFNNSGPQIMARLNRAIRSGSRYT